MEGHERCLALLKKEKKTLRDRLGTRAQPLRFSVRVLGGLGAVFAHLWGSFVQEGAVSLGYIRRL